MPGPLRRFCLVLLAASLTTPGAARAQACFGVPGRVARASVTGGMMGVTSVDAFRVGGVGVLGPASLAVGYQPSRRASEPSRTWTVRLAADHGSEEWSSCSYLRVSRYHLADNPRAVNPTPFIAGPDGSFTRTTLGLGVGIGREFGWRAVTITPYASPRIETHVGRSGSGSVVNEQSRVGIGYDAGVSIGFLDRYYLRVGTLFIQPDGLTEYSRNEFVLELGVGW